MGIVNGPARRIYAAWYRLRHPQPEDQP
jgi:hypothetical protein